MGYSNTGFQDIGIRNLDDIQSQKARNETKIFFSTALSLFMLSNWLLLTTINCTH